MIRLVLALFGASREKGKFELSCQNPKVHVSRPCKIDISQDDKVPLFLPERPYSPHAIYEIAKLTAKKPVRPGRYCRAGPVNAFVAGTTGLAIANSKSSIVSAMSALCPRCRVLLETGPADQAGGLPR